MLFGLLGAPSPLQELVETILALVSHDCIHVYLDDIIVTSRTFSEHLQNFATVFGLLHQADFTLKLEKCTFGQHEIQYFDFKITRKEIQVNSSKTANMLAVFATK